MKTLGSCLFTLLASCLASHAISIPATEDSHTSRGNLTHATNRAASLSVDTSRRAFVYFDLADVHATTADQIRYARLRIFSPKVTAAGAGVSIHVVNSPWDETLPSTAPTYDSVPSATIPAQQIRTKRFASVDITEVVRNWVAGTVPNQGIAICSTAGAKLSIGAKEGSGSGYPAELEIELNPGAGTIGDQQLAANLTLVGTTTGTFSGNGNGLSGLQAANLVGQILNTQLADSGFNLSLGPGLGGSGAVLLGETLSLQNTGVVSLAATGGLTVSSNTGAITLGTNAVSTGTPGTLVQRDANGGFSAGTITASFSGDGSGLSNLPLPSVPAIRLTPGAITQQIPSNTSVALEWTVEDFDTHGMHGASGNKTRITANVDGIYCVMLNEQIALDSLYAHISLYKNGIEGPGLIARADKAPGTTNLSLSTLVELRVGDFVEASIVQNSGAEVSLSRFSRSFFTAHLIRPTP